MQKLLTYSTIIVLLICVQQATAQDEGFIYGKVTTIDNRTYEGALRWGKEEAYWTDMFNASKDKNENLDYLTRDQLEELEDRQRDFWERKGNWVNVSWTWDEDEDFVHQFVCQFGELKTLTPTGRNEVKVVLQSGLEYRLDGQGYNDIGTKVRVIDPELGTIELEWSRIELVEFMKTPSKLKEKFGEPLYGTVETSEGSFTGFVQWDHDERVSEDKLDGDTRDGDVSIAFGNIKSIERYGSSSSMIVLKSGRELELDDSNDVNHGNRGIIVTIDGLGRIDVPWDEFDKVTFTTAPGSGPAYNTFTSQPKINGTVTTRGGEQLSGDLIFDLDEAYQFEVIQGMLDDIEFIIPFRNIREFAPRNYDNSNITLKNGDKYMLSESQDVTDKNQGVLVISNGKAEYVRFDRVERITF